LVLSVFVAGTLVVGVWAAAAIVGLVSAPPIVIAVGLLAFVLVALGALQAARAVRHMAAPIDDLIDAAGRIEAGDYSVRVAARGPRGLRSLAGAFNEMSARLAANDATQRSFLADMAHELRTPLSVIQGQLEAIAEGVYPADEAHLDPVLYQVGILERLVEDLRTVALAEAGALRLDLEPVDLAALVSEAVDAVRRDATGIELTTDIDPTLPPIELDPARIRQVLSNLLVNALRHTPGGGHVTATVALAGTDRVAVSVQDTGSGIAPELLPRIFDRFVKGGASSGTGLGLAIARQLVEAHGGTISAESAPGQGTTIRFDLPIAYGRG
jgi:signal transduction histidine kinase